MKIFHTNHERRITNDESGAVLLLAFMVMVTLISVVGAYLGFVQTSTRSTGAQVVDSQAFYIADAGIHYGIYSLKQDLTFTGTTKNLGEGSYTVAVASYDFALATNGASASASSENGSYVAANAIDGPDSTYWQSGSKPTPSPGGSQEIIIDFPYTLTINKVHFLVPSGSSQQRPKDYTWQVSTNGTDYTPVVTVTGNNDTDVTDTFTAESDVNRLKLNVTKVGGGSEGVIIETLEVIGFKITSTGTVNSLNRTVEQTVVADDATETAADQIDWNEI